MNLFDPFGVIDRTRDAARLAGMAVGAAAFLGVTAWAALAAADARAASRQAELICAAAGRPFAAPRKVERGQACLSRVRALADFERQALSASNEILAAARAEQADKTRRDAALAARDQAAARAAAQAMEIQDDAVENDQPDAGWFDALNRLGGLRDPAR